ncbi:hypothetical protein SAMN05421823_101181 [Catalinimonas alkaloidigena]|uniref:Immunity protein 50 n=2 Tax=Catalinimonas alkaloidigena TaxID=1075417 RepID=A0A1G8WTF5_9BACT|nr:hypothetical protein SAMN05421823_101181 [Catalinimonas alkaloidigena]
MEIELEELLSNYVVGDGQISTLKINLDYHDDSKSTTTVELFIRKRAKKDKLEKCKIELQFEKVIEVGISEDFGSSYYSDITLVKQENGSYYFSLDPYGNTGQPHADDNLVITAKSLYIHIEGKKAASDIKS